MRTNFHLGCLLIIGFVLAHTPPSWGDERDRVCQGDSGGGCPGSGNTRERESPEERAASRERSRYVEAYNSGVRLCNENRCAEAENYFRRAIELRPGDADSWLQLGRSLEAQGRWGDAEAAFRRTTQLRPNDPASWAGLGRVLQRLERWAEAEAVFRRAIQLNGTQPHVMSNLSVVLVALGRKEEAERWIREAIRVGSDNFQATGFLNLGYVLHNQGRLEEADAAVREAIRLSPDNETAHSSLQAIRHDRINRANHTASSVRSERFLNIMADLRAVVFESERAAAAPGGSEQMKSWSSLCIDRGCSSEAANGARKITDEYQAIAALQVDPVVQPEVRRRKPEIAAWEQARETARVQLAESQAELAAIRRQPQPDPREITSQEAKVFTNQAEIANANKEIVKVIILLE